MSQLSLEKPGAASPETLATPSFGTQTTMNWIPLALLVLMPVLAVMCAKFVLLPSFQRAAAIPVPAPATLLLAKLPFFLPASTPSGSRFRNIGLVGNNPALLEMVRRNTNQLETAAAQILDAKTITHLKKQEGMDQVRARLLLNFNRVLGGNYVQQISLGDWSRL